MEHTMSSELQRNLFSVLTAIPLTALVFGMSAATFGYII